MKGFCVVLGLLLASLHLSGGATRAVQSQEDQWFQEGLNRWADKRTVEQWTQAIEAGKRAYDENRLDEAASFFQQAVVACDRKASNRIQQGVARLLLAETLLRKGNQVEARAQVDQIVKNLKKWTRFIQTTDSFDFDPDWKRLQVNLAVNAYRYQVGAALYLRAARAYCRMGAPQLAEPLFREAALVFEQNPPGRPFFHRGFFSTSGLPVYPLKNLRVAEILEAQCRFHLIQGRNELAANSLRQAVAFRNAPPFGLDELLLDQLVAEPLDKSFLSRFLEDCAFYQFDDVRTADLLVRQAVLLKKVGRTDEAMAFERFAESLRKKPLNPLRLI